MAAITCVDVSAGEAVRVPPAPRVLPDLATLDDQELLGIARSLPPASPRRDAARELLVSRHRRLVWLCVQRYRRGPEPAEDLMQVGYIGLLKAINNFDPAFGRTLAAYAQPCITGEIKRHFRDKRWQIHVQRSLKELVLQTREATLQLTQELGRTPADSDLARHLGVSTADIRDARRAELALQPSSLDAQAPGARSLADLLGTEDRQLEHMLDLQAVATHWGELPSREQKILLLRFGGDMTQAQIARQLGISQMHVSRLLAHALGHLRSRLLGLETSASGQPRRARQPSKKARTTPPQARLVGGNRSNKTSVKPSTADLPTRRRRAGHGLIAGLDALAARPGRQWSTPWAGIMAAARLPLAPAPRRQPTPGLVCRRWPNPLGRGRQAQD